MGAVQHIVRDQATGKVRYDHIGDTQSLIPWWAALHNRHNARANIVVLGDSYIEGYPCPLWKNTIVGWLGTLLNQRFPVINMTTGTAVTYGNARGFVGIPSTALIGATGNNPFSGWTFTTTGGVGHDETSGLGGKFAAVSLTVTGNKAVLAVPSGGLTSFDIQQILGASGSATGAYYKIDGGSAVTFNTYAATMAVSTLHVATAVTSTIEVGWNNAGGINLSGIVEYGGNENSGFAVHNCGLGGAKVSTWQTSSFPAGWLQCVAALSPNLLIVQLGGNEMLQNVASSTYQTNLTALITSIRGAGITCPIVMSMTAMAASVTAEPLQNYVTAARNVASSNPTMKVIENSVRVPIAGDTISPTYSMFHTDNLHGNANGNLYAAMASTIFQGITPQPA